MAAGVMVAVLLIAALTCGHFAHIAYFELAELNMLHYGDELITLANGSPSLDAHERSAQRRPVRPSWSRRSVAGPATPSRHCLPSSGSVPGCC